MREAVTASREGFYDLIISFTARESATAQDSVLMYKVQYLVVHGYLKSFLALYRTGKEALADIIDGWHLHGR